MAGPMEGTKVVELGVWVAGPAAGGILADWGADVVKIEPPTGDPARMFGRMLGIHDGVSPPFEMDNRGKRSIVLDLTTEDGRSTAFELLSAADVFLTNVRPAALRRSGLDFETVAARNPSLVYGLITGYGERGPDADRAAYDVAAFWARAGLAHLLTRPGETPPFQRGGMGDHTAGMTLAAAVCAALVATASAGSGPVASRSNRCRMRGMTRASRLMTCDGSMSIMRRPGYDRWYSTITRSAASSRSHGGRSAVTSATARS